MIIYFLPYFLFTFWIPYVPFTRKLVVSQCFTEKKFICLDEFEQCVLKARSRQHSVISHVGTSRWTDKRNTLRGPRVHVKCSLFFANFKQYWIRTDAMKIGLVVADRGRMHFGNSVRGSTPQPTDTLLFINKFSREDNQRIMVHWLQRMHDIFATSVLWEACAKNI